MSRFILVVSTFLFLLASFTFTALAQFGDEGFPNQVFAVLAEPPGSNCANGGTLIASGFDLNGNGFLGFNEVQQIGYACNGAPGEGIPGPEGPQGPQGVAGNDGAQGPQGPPGNDGMDGMQGPQGEPGVAGTDGQDGADGEDGINCWDLNGNGVGDITEDLNEDGFFNAQDCKGAQGLTGLDGLPGATGPQGPIGLTGPAGADGTDGAQGPQGEQGPAGATGPQGPAGADGADGAPGSDGNDGTDGDDGNSFAVVPIAILPDPCPNGGFSIAYGPDTDNDGIPDPATDTEKTICNGEDGATGATGAQGPQGLQGLNGTNGADGQAGADGQDGAQAFVRASPETIVGSCPGGEFGTFILFGEDLNGNGEFDLGSEIVDTTLLCDGQDGTDGAQGPAGPSGGAGRWSSTIIFTCGDGNSCSSERTCPVGEVLADTTCGFENPPLSNNTWVRFSGRRDNDRTSGCDVRNDSNSNNRRYEHAIYCVDE